MKTKDIESQVMARLPSLIQQIEEDGSYIFFSTHHNLLQSLGLNHEDIDSLLHLVNDYLAKEELEKALDLLVFLTILSPGNSIYYIKSGIILYKMEKFHDSISMFEGASLFDPQNPAPWLFMSNCYLKLDDKKKAKHALNKCIEVGKGSKDTEASDYIRLAKNSLKLGLVS